MPDVEWVAWRRRSPWDWVIVGRLVHLRQAVQLPLSVEVSLRTIGSRWRRWHLAFPCAPLLPMNGCLAVSSTLELVPQHSLVEAPTQRRSLSCRAACPSTPFVQGPICLRKQAVPLRRRCIGGKLFALTVCKTLEK